MQFCIVFIISKTCCNRLINVCLLIVCFPISWSQVSPCTHKWIVKRKRIDFMKGIIITPEVAFPLGATSQAQGVRCIGRSQAIPFPLNISPTTRLVEIHGFDSKRPSLIIAFKFINLFLPRQNSSPSSSTVAAAAAFIIIIIVFFFFWKIKTYCFPISTTTDYSLTTCTVRVSVFTCDDVTWTIVLSFLLNFIK